MLLRPTYSHQRAIRKTVIVEEIVHTIVVHFPEFLSAQSISSIGQIIESVCVSVSESVCHAKRVERSTDRNLPLMFTKLAMKVESQEVWLPIVFDGNTKHFYPPNEK